MLPKVTILVPSYNHSLYIADAIKSVWDQSYPDLQLIVVDDGSSDQSYEIICKLAAISPIEMLVVRQANQGICPTLNHALSLATGEVIGILASDDLMMPNRLLQEAVIFSKNSELKVLYSNGCFQYEGKSYGDVHKVIKTFLKRGIDFTLKKLLKNAPGFYIQAMLIKKDFLLFVGAFDEETGSDDWSLHIRIFRALNKSTNYIYFENNAFMYRLHDLQNHRNRNFLSPMKRRVVRKYFSLEGRAHYICNEYLRSALFNLLKGDFTRARRCLKKVYSIGSVNGVPWKCIAGQSIKVPPFLVRNILNKFTKLLLSIKKNTNKL